jgi:hypothetical protein
VARVSSPGGHACRPLGLGRELGERRSDVGRTEAFGLQSDADGPIPPPTLGERGGSPFGKAPVVKSARLSECRHGALPWAGRDTAVRQPLPEGLPRDVAPAQDPPGRCERFGVSQLGAKAPEERTLERNPDGQPTVDDDSLGNSAPGTTVDSDEDGAVLDSPEGSDPRRSWRNLRRRRDSLVVTRQGRREPAYRCRYAGDP